MQATRKRGTGITSYEEKLSDNTFTLEMLDGWSASLDRNGGSFFGAVSEQAYLTCQAIVASDDPKLSDPQGINERLVSCVVANEKNERATIRKDLPEAVIGNCTSVIDPRGRAMPGDWIIIEILPPSNVPMEDSPMSYARDISKFIEVAKDSIGEADADRAARWAFKAGVQWATATLKWQWDPVLEKHLEDVETRKINGAKGGRAEQKEERYAVLDVEADKAGNRFLAASDRQRVAQGKTMARAYDKLNPPIFTADNGHLLSDSWFKNWIAHYLLKKQANS